MFGLFRKRDKVGGDIAYYGLDDWWLYEFSAEERDVVRDIYKPLGTSEMEIDRGRIAMSTMGPLKFTSGVAGWLNKEPTRHLAYKFLWKSDEFHQTDQPVLDRHFALQGRCEVFYRWRDIDEFALGEAISSCEKSRNIAPDAAKAFMEDMGFLPRHHCYQQLAIIEEKRGDIERALALSREAHAGGWGAGWDVRIAKLERKLARQK